MIASVYLFLVRDGKIFLGRRTNTGYEDGKYGLVAGHVERDESITNAAIREAKEEAGIEINPEHLTLKTTMHRVRRDGDLLDERVDFFFEVSHFDGEPHIAKPDKCDHVEWFPFDQLPANILPFMRQGIECYVKGIPYSEFGW